MGAIPQIWKSQRQRYTLTGQVCRRCGHLSLSPRVVCPQCHPVDVEEDLRLTEAERSGELLPYIMLPIDLWRERMCVPVPRRQGQDDGQEPRT